MSSGLNSKCVSLTHSYRHVSGAGDCSHGDGHRVGRHGDHQAAALDQSQAVLVLRELQAEDVHAAVDVLHGRRRVQARPGGRERGPHQIGS